MRRVSTAKISPLVCCAGEPWRKKEWLPMNALNGNGILLLEQRKVTHLEVTDGSLPLPVFYVQSQRMGTKKWRQTLDAAI